MKALINAGTLLLRQVPRPTWASADLLPAEIISASDCLCPQFPGSYAIAWTADSDERRAERFDAIGLPPEARPAAIEWATGSFEVSFGWPGVFYSLEDAQAARTSFFSDAGNILVIGLGLPPEFVEAFVTAATPPPPMPGYSPMGEAGYFEVVKQGRPLPARELLGFELLDVEFGMLTHSWLCNGLEAHFAGAFGIRPNVHGLLGDLESAVRCCEAIERERIGAEPGLWLPWGLVKY